MRADMWTSCGHLSGLHLHSLLLWHGWNLVDGHVCESFWLLLSNSYPAVLLQLKSDDRPPHVVTVLMQELSANNENDWAEHLVGEMVEGAASFKHSQDAMHILKESLALSCFGEEFVREQLKAGQDGLHHCLAATFDCVCSVDKASVSCSRSSIIMGWLSSGCMQDSMQTCCMPLPK